MTGTWYIESYAEDGLSAEGSGRASNLRGGVERREGYLRSGENGALHGARGRNSRSNRFIRNARIGTADLAVVVCAVAVPDSMPRNARSRSIVRQSTSTLAKACVVELAFVDEESADEDRSALIQQDSKIVAGGVVDAEQCQQVFGRVLGVANDFCRKDMPALPRYAKRVEIGLAQQLQTNVSSCDRRSCNRPRDRAGRYGHARC